MPGVKLILTAGAPGPWSEAIKKVLEYKRVPYVPTLQRGGETNKDLVAWTGIRNAPVIVNEGDPPLVGWAEMLMFAERLAPSPALLPADSALRVLVFGIINELAGEWGFGWCRRLMSYKAVAGMNPTRTKPTPLGEKIAADYGANPEALDAAPERVADILRMLSDRIVSQRAAGSLYLVGDKLTAADIYWAAFSAQLDPMPEDVNPMPDVIRRLYKITDPTILAAASPLLIEHRDNIFKTHFTLPLDF